MKTKHLNNDQYNALRGALGGLLNDRSRVTQGLGALLSILADTGIRCDELVKLKYRDLIQGTKALNIGGSKGSYDRTLRLSEVTFTALVELTSHHMLGPDDFLFAIALPQYRVMTQASDRHAAKQWLRVQWRSLRRVLYGPDGEALGLHCLRHTVAVRLLEHTDGHVIKTKVALGHRAIASTLHYVDYLESQDVQDDILEALKIKKG